MAKLDGGIVERHQDSNDEEKSLSGSPFLEQKPHQLNEKKGDEE